MSENIRKAISAIGDMPNMEYPKDIVTGKDGTLIVPEEIFHNQYHRDKAQLINFGIIHAIRLLEYVRKEDTEEGKKEYLEAAIMCLNKVRYSLDRILGPVSTFANP